MLWGGPVHLLPWSVAFECPEAALMIVGNLTYAIVILMDVHGEAYQFTAFGKGRQKTVGGQMLGEKALNHPTQLLRFFFFCSLRKGGCAFLKDDI